MSRQRVRADSAAQILRFHVRPKLTAQVLIVGAPPVERSSSHGENI